MHLLEEQSIELSCSKLCNQFAIFNDSGRYEQLAALFVEAGRYARPTDPENFVKGRIAIHAAFMSRPPDKVTRHLITNTVIDVTGSTTAKGICYITLYSGSTTNPAEKFGFRANTSQLIGEYRDDFVLTESGWRFSQRSGRLLFTT